MIIFLCKFRVYGVNVSFVQGHGLPKGSWPHGRESIDDFDETLLADFSLPLDIDDVERLFHSFLFIAVKHDFEVI